MVRAEPLLLLTLSGVCSSRLTPACLQARQWLADGCDFGLMAINIASQQLNSNSLTGQIERVLYKIGPPTRLQLELTESSLVDPSISVSKALEALRKLGIHIAIDDFGTGYSSLFQNRLPLKAFGQFGFRCKYR